MVSNDALHFVSPSTIYALLKSSRHFSHFEVAGIRPAVIEHDQSTSDGARDFADERLSRRETASARRPRLGQEKNTEDNRQISSHYSFSFRDPSMLLKYKYCRRNSVVYHSTGTTIIILYI